MKDLLEKLIGLIPAYFDDLLALVSGPKRFFAERLLGQPAMEKALLFLAVSFSITWLLTAPFNRGDPFLELGTDAAFALAYIVAYGVALYLAWWLAGGRAEIRKFLPIHFYYAGVLKLIFALVFLGTMGALRAADPASYKAMLEAIYAGNAASFFLRNSRANAWTGLPTLAFGFDHGVRCYGSMDICWLGRVSRTKSSVQVSIEYSRFVICRVLRPGHRLNVAGSERARKVEASCGLTHSPLDPFRSMALPTRTTW
jgi:hypothetical protein